jgi:hypothetical protein
MEWLGRKIWLAGMPTSGFGALSTMDKGYHVTTLSAICTVGNTLNITALILV